MIRSITSGGGAVVPDSFGIHQQNRSLQTDPQAVGLGTKDGGGPLLGRDIQLQFLEAMLEVVPGFQAGFFVTALGLGLVGHRGIHGAE